MQTNMQLQPVRANVIFPVTEKRGMELIPLQKTETHPATEREKENQEAPFH